MTPLHDRPTWLKAAFYAAAMLLVMLAVGPALWLVNVAVQPADQELSVGDVTPPAKYTLANFASVFAEADLARPLINSVIVTAAQATLGVFLAAAAAYPLARMKFGGKNVIFFIILATLMVPEQVIAIPQFVTIAQLGLYDTLIAVFLPFGVTAFGVYLCRQALLAVPGELEEAARIDGANALQTWWHVMLPLIRPTLATLAVFSVIGAWSNLLWPLIVLQSEHKMTLPVAINRLLSVYASNPRLAYAGSVLALIPMVCVYIVAQRWLVRGITAGAVKG